MRINIQKVIHRVYDEVHAALWAVLCAGIAYILIFVVPHVPEIRAKAELLRIREIADENRFYCEKWGMPEGTHRFMLCTLDLQKIRAEAERRILNENSF